MLNLKRAAAGGLLCFSLLFAVGCGQQHDDQRGRGDAPVAGRSGEDSPKHVTNNPDGFGNVVTGCVAGAPGWRYFATTNTGAPSNLVVLADKACS